MMNHDPSPARSATRQRLPNRRESITCKIRVGNCRTVYLSTHAANPPMELFVRVKGTDCTAETVALYDILARLASLALQYGAPVETVGTMLQGVKVEPAGIVTGHPTMHFCSSLPDAIGQHLLSLSPDAPPPPRRPNRGAATRDTFFACAGNLAP